MKMLVTGGAGFIGSNFIFYERKKHPEHEIKIGRASCRERVSAVV